MEVTLQNLNKQEKTQLWANRIHECRNSPLSVTKWCKENEIKPGTYYFWQNKIFNRAKNEPKFTEISVTDSPKSTILTDSPKIIAIMTINEVKVEIYAGSTAVDIQNLIRGLKSC